LDISTIPNHLAFIANALQPLFAAKQTNPAIQVITGKDEQVK